MSDHHNPPDPGKLPAEAAQEQVESAPEGSWTKWFARIAVGIILILVILVGRGCYMANQPPEDADQKSSTADFNCTEL